MSMKKTRYGVFPIIQTKGSAGTRWMLSVYKILLRTSAQRGTAGTLWVLFGLAALLGAGSEVRAAEGFVTTTFGNKADVEHPKTLRAEKDLIRFDLSALPAGVKVHRAILRFPFRSDYAGHSAVKLAPGGVSEKPLPTQPPAHDALNATEAVLAWVADPGKNLEVRVLSA